MRRLLAKGIMAAAGLLVLAGCVNIDQEILVKKDGSGQFVGVVDVPDMSAMLAALGGAKEDGNAAEAAQKQALEEAKKTAEALAAKIEGAKVESVELVPAADKKPARIKTVVSFPDINKVNLEMINDRQEQEAKDDDDDDDDDGRITYKDGVLTIKNDSSDEVFDKLGDMGDDEARQQLKQALPFMPDGTMRIAIRVEGAITETNARHVNKDKTAVLLGSVPIKGLLEAMLNKSEDLAKANKIEDKAERAKAVEALIPGLKLEGAETITIKFQ